MGRAKITVVRTDFYPEFNAYRTIKAEGPCEQMKVGDVFYTSGSNLDDIPEGFCPYAWSSIRKYAMAYATGGKVNMADLRMGCCSSGVRPVYFVVEAAKE